MHSEPAPGSSTHPDEPSIPGPAVSRPTPPSPKTAGGMREILPPYVVRRSSDEPGASEYPRRSAAPEPIGAELSHADEAPDSDAAALVSEPANESEEAGASGSGIASGEDLAWLEAIDWGDERSPDEAGDGDAELEVPLQHAEHHPQADGPVDPDVPGPTGGESADEDADVLSEDDSAGTSDTNDEDVPSWIAWATEDEEPHASASGDDEGSDVVEIDTLLAVPEPVGEGAQNGTEPSAVPGSLGEPMLMESRPDNYASGEDDSVEPSTFGATDPASQESEDLTPDTDGVDQPDRGLVDRTASEVEPLIPLEPGAERSADSTGSVEHVPDRAIEELASRLESLAGSLRTRPLPEVVARASSSDPLEVLLAGYALGFVRGRSDAGDASD
jgi:hypothetical protein